MAVDIPEAHQGRTEPPSHLYLSVLQRPHKGRAQIAVIALQSIEPHFLLGAGKLRIRGLSKGQVVLGVPFLYRRPPGSFQALGGVLADDFQHHKARLTTPPRPLLLCEQVLVKERGDTRERPTLQITRRVAYRFGGGQGAAINENTETGKELALPFVEQVIAPGYRVAQGAMPGG